MISILHSITTTPYSLSVFSTLYQMPLSYLILSYLIIGPALRLSVRHVTARAKDSDDIRPPAANNSP